MGPGISLIHGANGNGKSNLLEAIYMLAVAKSPRALNDRELVGFVSPHDQIQPDLDTEQIHTRVTAKINRSTGTISVQIDLLGSLRENNQDETLSTSSDGVHWQGHTFQKLFRVNGAPRRASELVGEVNAVLFSAQDLELIYGPPSMRRRYLDMLISQHNRQYLRTLQRYQRAVTQRNFLLRSIRDGRSHPRELNPWDATIAEEGGYLIATRATSIEALHSEASLVYADLSAGSQVLKISCQTTIVAPNPKIGEKEQAEKALSASLINNREQDIIRGHTSGGPHRDDFRICVDNADAARYSSRGQARTAVLALKLAEAQYLSERRGETPMILLDDVLSELDPFRRELVIERVSAYDQCLITTAEPEAVTATRRARMHIYEVRAGSVAHSNSCL